MDGYGPAGGAARAEDGTPLAAPASAPRWSPARLVATVVVAFALAVAATGVVMFALEPRGPLADRTPEQILLLTVATDGTLLLVVATVGRWLLRLRPSDIGLVAPTWGMIGFGLSFGVALYALSIVVNVAQTQIAGSHPQDLVLAFGSHIGARAYVVDLLTGSVIAPFSEEIFFRGLIFGGLAQRMPVVAAAAVSALLFALLHGLGVIAPIFVLGLGLAYVYRHTGTIWASMATHSLVNATSLTLLFLLRPGP